MAWRTIIAGDYGFTCELRAVDRLIQSTGRVGQPQDISNYPTVEFLFYPPSAASFARSAAFVSDGEDGRVVYTAASNDFPVAQAGEWRVRLRVSNGSAQVTSDPHTFQVVAT